MARYGLLPLSFPTPALATGPVNYYHKPEVATQWEQLLAHSPRDPIIIPLYALRQGLFGVIDTSQRDSETAVRAFHLEHVRGAIERYRIQQARERDIQV